jgi:hypothetical protein
VAQERPDRGGIRCGAFSKGTYLGAHYARLKGRRGPKKAAVAVGHSILVICYHILERGEPYQELADTYFNRRRSEEAYRKRLVREAKHSRVIGPIPDQLGNFFPTNSGPMLMTAGQPLS